MFLKRSGVEANSPRVTATLTPVVLAVLGAMLLAAPAGAAKKADCRDADLVPAGPADSVRLQLATRCLINRERRTRGLKGLRASVPLLKASDWQNQDMVTFEYFDHNRPNGPRFVKRILRFGYADDARGYAIAENIAWASQQIATPRKMVGLWMHSPTHRENILTPGYRDQAVSAVWSNGGVGGAYAESGGPFLVYTNQFGTRY